MQDQAFKILEYHELRALIRRGAQTSLGKGRVDALEPFENISGLQKELSALSECVDLRRRGVSWTFSELGDICNPEIFSKGSSASTRPLPSDV